MAVVYFINFSIIFATVGKIELKVSSQIRVFDIRNVDAGILQGSFGFRPQRVHERGSGQIAARLRRKPV